MGWARYFLLGDFGQQLDLADQKAEIAKLKHRLQSAPGASESVEQRLAALQRDNDQLKLYLAATVRLLIAKGHATTGEVAALVDAIDGEDGATDGRLGGDILPG